LVQRCNSNKLKQFKSGSCCFAVAIQNQSHTLPEAIRVEVISLLNQRLAACIDLQLQCKQAHWNVKGPTFIALHELFDKIDEDVENYSDLLAERVVQLGGTPAGA
jgi:starvation-inducible DNA-binding protein